MHEVGKLVVGDITAGARHPAPLCDVVHHLDFPFPCVDIPPVLLFENPGGRHQGIKVLPTTDLSNNMHHIQNVFNNMLTCNLLPMKEECTKDI